MSRVEDFPGRPDSAAPASPRQGSPTSGATVWVFPGQGAQRAGMGDELFERFPDRLAQAETILGHSLRIGDPEAPEGLLTRTRFVQPLLFVVNALAYLARREEIPPPDFLAGHSLGELNALWAAGCFDFATGVRLVQRRGELMGRAEGGAMLAVIGAAPERVLGLVARHGLSELELASHNAPLHVVLSGPRQGIRTAAEILRGAEGLRCVPLDVSAAFHSRAMDDASERFGRDLRRVELAAPRIPVIANVDARPYPAGRIPQLLARQIRSPVCWNDSLRFLLDQGVEHLHELGPGRTLTGFWRSVRRATADDRTCGSAPRSWAGSRSASASEPQSATDGPTAETLGSSEFRRQFGVRWAYVAGSMYKATSSTELVIRMARAGLLGFFGSGGLELAEVAAAISTLQGTLGPTQGHGMNLLHSPSDPALEEATVALYLEHGVRRVEAAGFTRVTPSLAWYRYQGARRDGEGRVVAARQVLAKASRRQVAEAFLSPPPREIVETLVGQGKLTSGEAELASELPLCDALCVESDSGGHSDGGVALALVPALVRLRDARARTDDGVRRIPVGAAGGIGTPEAAAAAFLLGADFVLTGSINQCSPEAGTSDAVKDILAQLDTHDTAYAPAGDLFESGTRVQVVKKGILFPARANKLYQLYRQHESLDEIDSATRRTLEHNYFKRSLAEAWEETRRYLESRGRTEELAAAEHHGRRKMALVFRWYLTHGARLARRGVVGERVNYQIQCGPAMGAFNAAVRGTELEPWRARHVDRIAELLMRGAAEVFERRLRAFAGLRSRPEPLPGAMAVGH